MAFDIVGSMANSSMKNAAARLVPTITFANMPDLLTLAEVAHVLRVSPLTIKRWGKRGKLPAIRINSRGDRRYKKEAVLWVLGMQFNTK
jgi:excisionase family DNA binding protein